MTILKEWFMWLIALLGEGLCLQRGQFSSHHKSGNKIWQFKQWYIWTATIPLQIIAIWGAYYLARIPVHIVLLNEGYHYQTRRLFEVKQAEYIGVQWPWQIPRAISPPPSWVSYPLCLLRIVSADTSFVVIMQPICSSGCWTEPIT